MKKFLLPAIAIALTLSLSAQHPGGPRGGENASFKGVIRGVVRDAGTGSGIEYATVMALRLKDSTLVNGTISGPDGKFSFEVGPGRYLVRVEFLSYDKTEVSPVMVHPGNPVADLGELLLHPDATDLEGVEVTGERSQVSIGLDKKVFNVEKDLTNIGGSARDVLDNVPSVYVDMDGNINLRGSTNVRLLIDGKPSTLTGISSADVLDQLPANSIESIEVITNPSARYDAEGLAGIINIKLKKNRLNGINGLVNLTAGWPHNHTASFNVNHKNGPWNLFAAYTARYRDRPGNGSNERTITLNDTTTWSDQFTDFHRYGFSHYLNAGAEYAFTPKSSLTGSVVVRSASGGRETFTTYSDYDFNRILTSYHERQTLEPGKDLSFDYNLSFDQRFERKRQHLSASMRYSTGQESEMGAISEQWFDSNLNPLGSYSLLQRIATADGSGSFTGQVDYQHPWGEKGLFEAGYKITTQDLDNSYEVTQLMDSSLTWEILPEVTNHFRYNEMVNAAYLIAGNKAGKFSFQAGIRAEQTRVKTALLETSESDTKQYLDFFPSLHLGFEFTEGNIVQVSYSRRLRRPHAYMLNPFHSYSDPLNQWMGNPNLDPEYTHSFEAGYVRYTRKWNMSASLYYRHTDNVIQRFREVQDNGISLTYPVNMSTRDNFGAELVFSGSVFDWWRLNGSVNYFREQVDGGNLGEQYTSDTWSYTARANSVFYFWKKAQLQATFNYRGPRETTQGTFNALYFLDLGLQKSILSDKGTIGFRISDVFNSRRFSMDYDLEGLQIHSTFRHGVRTFLLNFTYKINNYQNQRNRSGGNEYMEEMGY